MDQNKIKLAIQKAIQTLGAPVMSYSPTHANLEREIMIDKTVTLLFRILRQMENDSESD